MSTIQDIGIPEIGQGILQPKQKHKWRVEFQNIGNSPTGIPLSLQATTVERPKLSFEEVELNRYNSKVWIAGKHTFEPVTLVVEDDVTGKASQVIQEQQDNQQLLIGAAGQFLASQKQASLYKFATIIQQLDGNDQEIERWILEGSWLQNVDYGDLDYSSSEAVTITLTIRYDHARQVGVTFDDTGLATGGAGV